MRTARRMSVEAVTHSVAQAEVSCGKQSVIWLRRSHAALVAPPNIRQKKTLTEVRAFQLEASSGIEPL
ncbi:hypothetical protein [Stenotrophomonas maltophilia]|uniref:hypothetical protein n=1 Tax=Stenotrophomonas maltophilia TaxID=40324 RepID=UPI0034D4FA9A